MTLRREGAEYRGAIQPQTVAIARSSFANPNLAMDRLFEVFPDKYPELVAQSNEVWTFALGWPRHILEFVDPLLTERARTCFGVGLSDLDQFLEIEWHDGIPLVFSMFHSWALLAPVLTMTGNRTFPQVIVHVDAHHDLAPSLMGLASPGLLVSQEFGVECRLDTPDTIYRAVQAGLISKANFLTAYLLAAAGRRLVHVETGCIPDEFELRRMIAPISIGNLCATQHELTFQRTANEGGCSILELPELPKVLGLEPENPVWLDIDLDAFCNRFDGDSNNRNSEGSSQEAAEATRRVECFLSDLSNADWRSNISAVSIAASPGFFPSEYWEALIPAIRDGVRRLLTK